jgi:ABC-2 type transport system permease protein
MREASPRLADLCALNPFTQAVEMIRFAAYGQVNLPALGWTVLAFVLFAALGVRGYDPGRGLMKGKG